MKNLLSVGQCAADHSRITDTIGGRYGVEIQTADSHDDAIKQAQETKFDLIMINRILDATHTEGLDLIRALKSSPATSEIPVMIISNFEAAQTDAVAAGAIPGFGKAALSEDSTFKILDQYLSA